jgi:hypothetical protein
VTCDDAAGEIPSLASDDGVVLAAVRDHVAVCLRCQAEVSRYRRMVRDLRTLQGERLLPPAEAVAHTLSAMGAEHPGRRPVVVGGVVATAGAAAAGVAGMLVWRSRRRVLAG